MKKTFIHATKTFAHQAHVLFAFIIGTAFLSACSTIPTTGPDYLKKPGAIEEDYYDVNITTHDGKRLRATVFQPALKAGETAPIVLHAHGFGVFRMSGPISLYGLGIYAGQSAKEAWKQGYWVISYDERGHGASEGIIRVMSPEHEVKDISTIIDWATNNLHRVSMDGPNDPKVGMIGESYGGGAQLMGAVQDPRIDALIPVTTWHSFLNSLTPNDVPKSGWLTTLILSGNVLNPGNMSPVLNKAYWQAREGQIGSEIFEFLGSHSPQFNCNNDLLPTDVDVLLIQGFRDVLFPLNEAIFNKDCLQRAGSNDVRLIGTQDGHLLPLTQWSNGLPGYNIETNIHCNEDTFNMVEMAVDWFDEKLKGIYKKADYIPNICLSQGYNHGVVLNKVPVGGPSFEFSDVNINSNFTGFFESALMPFEWLAGLITPRLEDPKLEEHQRTDASMRPAFIPLYVSTEDQGLTGIPRIQLELTSDDDSAPVVFAGLGVKRASNRQIELINQQITPIKGIGNHDLDMMAVSTRLEKGDIAGLLIYGYSNQYRFSGANWLNSTKLSGAVQIPLLPANSTNIAHN
ncbi:hypothetical protein A9Q99_27095 [Gammaproteobacteria bacterium 45_16_T64]|nr:hypothetical protein A9Q99_27095 [Gammaproteobacteria bacterium 45_16_T64]